MIKINYEVNDMIHSVEIDIEEELAIEINKNIQGINESQNKKYKHNNSIKVFENSSENLSKNTNDTNINIPKNFRKFDINSEKRYEVIKVNNGGFELKESRNILENACKVAIVLESPHTSEYSDDFQPVGPIKNLSTSTRIKNNINNIIKNLSNLFIEKNQFDIYLINPVKFQTSLGSFYEGKLNKKIRDKLWASLYNNVYKQDFLKEIEEYDIVINCCTHINSESGKKQITKDLLLQEHRYRVIECNNHPCVWGKDTEFLVVDNIFKF